MSRNPMVNQSARSSQSTLEIHQNRICSILAVATSRRSAPRNHSSRSFSSSLSRACSRKIRFNTNRKIGIAINPKMTRVNGRRAPRRNGSRLKRICSRLPNELDSPHDANGHFRHRNRIRNGFDSNSSLYTVSFVTLTDHRLWFTAFFGRSQQATG